MRKTVRSVSSLRLHEVLLSLGYYQPKQHQYRRGKFHIIVKPFKKRIDINIHVNHLRRFAIPFFAFHRARKTGKDLKEELDRIVNALKKH